ncbi:MAG: preprotein translocase subunit SecG [Methylococcaceae bacterium NSM2-1]|nr:MAG: preprotein translocase subunit SecG [Methylococcaceae bacterium NSM2-1]
MYQVIIVIHVLLGLGIIGLILIQQGKGADAGAAFGTGSAGSVFGAQGAASFLSRATAILATLFFITSLGLAVINGHKGVAFDLMSAPETQQDTLGLPEVSGAKSVDTPLAMPEIKSEEMPAVPEAKPTEQPSGPVSGAKIENIVVPKAEEIKTIKEQNNTN